MTPSSSSIPGSTPGHPGSAPGPRIGCCASPDRAEAVRSAGFDFIELPAASALQADLDGSEFAPQLALLEGLSIPIDAFNVFLPGDLKIVGDEIDRDRIHRYVHHAMDRASAVGAKIMVFGSGRARNVPEGFDPEAAWAQVGQFLEEVAPEAERYGITLAIEPLHREETNLITSVPDAVEMAMLVNHPSVKALADLYHMVMEDEPLLNLVDAQGWLAHVHVADTGRLAPGTGEYETVLMFHYLKSIGYAGRISVECKWNDFDAEAAAACAFLRDAWSRA